MVGSSTCHSNSSRIKSVVAMVGGQKERFVYHRSWTQYRVWPGRLQRTQRVLSPRVSEERLRTAAIHFP
jgi:hypothetical protein